MIRNELGPDPVLVGAHDIAGQIVDYATGFRLLGKRTHTAVRVRNKFYESSRFDYDFTRRPSAGRLQHFLSVLPLIRKHQLFLFQWAGFSLLGHNLDYYLIRACGKQLLTVCNGDDTRHWSAYDQHNQLAKRETRALFELDANYAADPVGRPLRNLRISELLSSCLFSTPNQADLAVRPYHRFNYPLDLTKYKPRVGDNAVPLVVHAPSNQNVKGTPLILAALDELRQEGVRFELLLLEGRDNAAVLQALSDADVVIDQLHLPLYGKFAAEAMASGCAVASADDPIREYLPRSRPIHPLSTGNLKSELRELLTNRQLRVELASKSLEYIKLNHSCERVCQAMLDALAGKSAPDYIPTFFLQSDRLPEGVVLSHREKLLNRKAVRAFADPSTFDWDDLKARDLI